MTGPPQAPPNVVAFPTTREPSLALGGAGHPSPTTATILKFPAKAGGPKAATFHPAAIRRWAFECDPEPTCQGMPIPPEMER
jgi:hypothetical protein